MGTFSVQLPDGTWVKDIPNGTSKEKFFRKMYANDPKSFNRNMQIDPSIQKFLPTESLQKSAAASAPSVLGPLPVLGYTAGGAIQTLAGVLSPIFQNPTLAPLQMGPEISTAIAEKGPVKAAVEAVPGGKGIVSGIDLAKRYAFGGAPAEQLGLQRLGSPLTSESISEAQKNIAEGTGSLAALGAIPKLSESFVAKSPAENIRMGTKDLEGQLATTTAKKGQVAAKLKGQIAISKGDLAKAYSEVDPKLKGAEKAHDLVEKAMDWREQIWDQGHEPGIARWGDEQADMNRVYNAVNRKVNEGGKRVALLKGTDNARANEWNQTAVRPPMTLRELDYSVRKLNEQLRNMDPKAYGPDELAARFEFLKAAREEIDRVLEKNGEPGIKQYNKRWGALGQVIDQLRVQAVKEAAREAKNQKDFMPSWVHVYSFWHGGAIPFIGVSSRLAGMLQRTPMDIVFRGLDRLKASGIEPAPFPSFRLTPPPGRLPPMPVPEQQPLNLIPGSPEALRMGRLLGTGEETPATFVDSKGRIRAMRGPGPPTGPLQPAQGGALIRTGIDPATGKPFKPIRVQATPVTAGSELTPTGGARGYTTAPQPRLRYKETFKVTPAEIPVPESAKTSRMLPSGAPEVFDPKSGLPPQPGQVTTFMGKTWFFDGSDWKIIR